MMFIHTSPPTLYGRREKHVRSEIETQIECRFARLAWRAKVLRYREVLGPLRHDPPWLARVRDFSDVYHRGSEHRKRHRNRFNACLRVGHAWALLESCSFRAIESGSHGS